MLEPVILLMIYLIEYDSKQNRRFKSKHFQHDHRNNESKTFTNLIVQNVIQIKSGKTINADVNVKMGQSIMCAKNIIFGILLHVVLKIRNI